MILRRIKSFVRRDGRMTEAQSRAFETLRSRFGLTLEMGELTFSADKPRVLEIGFGNGTSLAAMAALEPSHEFVGIETHLPGVGSLYQQIEARELTNLRVYYADAVEVLEKCVPDGCLDVIQIFFPDPWPKRKHHKRRLIQTSFVTLLSQKLKPSGVIHLATDWEDYAKHMMKVLSGAAFLKNTEGEGAYAQRSTQRPIVTKFEERGLRAGYQIWELRFIKR